MVELTYFLLILTAFILIIDSYFDLKLKMIPDWFSYFLLACGLFGGVLLSLFSFSIQPFIISFLSSLFLGGLGYLLFKAGAWGGGDVKLAFALGANLGLIEKIAIWPFVISFWLNALIFGAIFGIIYMSFLIYKNRKVVFSDFKKNKFFKNIFLISTVFCILSLLFTTYFKISLIFVTLFCLTDILIIFKIAEKHCMIKAVKPSQLTEGDWVLDEIKIGDYIFVPKKTGIEKKDIDVLAKLEKEGKLKEVKIKDGIPYVPAFLASFFITYFYGDIISKILYLLLQ
ncbi:MAG: A24 family peptidase [Candidatus Nanoarchaeia archaeon]